MFCSIPYMHHSRYRTWIAMQSALRQSAGVCCIRRLVMKAKWWGNFSLRNRNTANSSLHALKVWIVTRVVWMRLKSLLLVYNFLFVCYFCITNKQRSPAHNGIITDEKHEDYAWQCGVDSRVPVWNVNKSTKFVQYQNKNRFISTEIICRRRQCRVLSLVPLNGSGTSAQAIV